MARVERLEPLAVGLRQVGQIRHNPAVLLRVDQELAVRAEIEARRLYGFGG